MEIKSSSSVSARNLKILFWGATATRKTETVLRNFPNVLVIDTEGNVEQCIGVKEIPEFLFVKTKDPREIVQVIEQVSSGKIKFNDGRRVETLALDSSSMLWSALQEIASASAENRAKKYGRNVESATTTQLDWVLAKRPLKTISNRINGTNIKYLVYIAREKDLYEEKPGGELKKTGITMDVPKGTEYDMNLVMHFTSDAGKWVAEVTKVQGALGYDFPLGKKFGEFPFAKLKEYADKLKPMAENIQDDDKIAKEIVAEETEERTQKSLLEYGASLGMSASEVGLALKSAGFTGFDAKQWEAMKGAITVHAVERVPEN